MIFDIKFLSTFNFSNPFIDQETISRIKGIFNKKLLTFSAIIFGMNNAIIHAIKKVIPKSGNGVGSNSIPIALKIRLLYKLSLTEKFLPNSLQ